MSYNYIDKKIKRCANIVQETCRKSEREVMNAVLARFEALDRLEAKKWEMKTE